MSKKLIKKYLHGDIESKSNYKSGGRLIPKHSKGNPVNNNPLPKRPINTNPTPEVKPKKSKGLLIRPDFKNERPVPGLLTSPRIIGVNNLPIFK